MGMSYTKCYIQQTQQTNLTYTLVHRDSNELIQLIALFLSKQIFRGRSKTY